MGGPDEVVVIVTQLAAFYCVLPFVGFRFEEVLLAWFLQMAGSCPRAPVWPALCLSQFRQW